MSAEVIDFATRRALPFHAIDAAVVFRIGDRLRLRDGEVARLLDWPEIHRADGTLRVEFLVHVERTGYRRLVPVSQVERLDPEGPTPPCDVAPFADGNDAR
ncbi:MAG: hypothetical protein AB7F67_04000 [Rhodospirillaceae bacterium]